MTAETFTATLALIGIVILVSSLLSGVVERTGVPQVAIFLLLGAVLGPIGLGVFDLGLDSPALRVITTLGLVLVLFSDAISVDLREIRQNARLALLVLGPGTLIPAALIATASWIILDLHWAASAILGAALASTDPVLLRGLLRRTDVPGTARLALRLESGMNDAVLLPIVVVSMLFLHGAMSGEQRRFGELAVGLLILGPGAGVVAGLVGITLLDRVRRKFGVRRDYESLYALGVALTAFAAAEAVGGSGFLAAFTAGLMVAALDVELCDCFLDYGEATAEMFLLLTFVAFGASLIWMGLEVIAPRTILFAAVALAVRTVVLFPVLAQAGIDRRSLRLIAWFGPRGLSTLLLVLLPVFEGIVGSQQLFAVACLVVLISVVVHGSAIALLVRRDRRTAQPQATGEVAAEPVPPARDGGSPERITLDELRTLQDAGEQVILVDVRTERTFRTDPFIARGAVRLAPDDAVQQAHALRLPWKATLVAYCA